ncbi:MAG: alpha/beta hydrolase [Clostridia bacterium]|nr:alpha/beta hydrolase [Clostridia bacterium]
MAFAIIPTVLILFVLISSYLAYLKAFYNRRGRKRDASVLPPSDEYKSVKSITDELVAEIKALEWEQIYITSRDGLKLAAKYHHISDEAPLHIQFHGYRGSAYRDFCGGNKLARDMGHNTIIVDQRAHGESEGHTISFGIKERLDCLDWINYAIERFGKDKKIIISGLSMGASTVLMAACEALPENVVGIIADCPYSSPKEIIMKVCRDIGLPPKPSYPFVYLGAIIFGGFRLTECDPVAGARNSKIPILLLHGEQDNFVPLEMSQRIAEANPEKIKFLTFEGAGHGLSFIVQSEIYVKETMDFINKVTK